MRRCEVFWEGGVWVAEKRRRDFALALAGVAGAGCTFALRVGPTTPCVAIRNSTSGVSPTVGRTRGKSGPGRKSGPGP